MQIPSQLDRWTQEADVELGLANLVVVPSRQVAHSLTQLVPDDRIVLAPYGCPPVPSALTPILWDGVGPLRAVFVGRIESVKGVAHLSRAVASLAGRVELTMIGPVPASVGRAVETFLGSVRYLGRMPRSDVLAELGRNHVFVLPSLVEGRSLAVLEAVSVGLPIIVTPGSGTDDIAEAGAGWVVPARDSDAIAEVLERLISNPYLIEETSKAALVVATLSSWSRYTDCILEAL